MVKIGTKKKRTKQQLDQVRNEELELRANRHAFLLNVQQLKEEARTGSNQDVQVQQELQKRDQLLQQSQAEKENIHQEFQHMRQELQVQVAQKDDLHTKLQQLYATLKENTSDKKSIDSIFNQVMGSEDVNSS